MQDLHHVNVVNATVATPSPNRKPGTPKHRTQCHGLRTQAAPEAPSTGDLSGWHMLLPRVRSPSSGFIERRTDCQCTPRRHKHEHMLVLDSTPPSSSPTGSHAVYTHHQRRCQRSSHMQRDDGAACISGRERKTKDLPPNHRSFPDLARLAHFYPFHSPVGGRSAPASGGGGSEGSEDAEAMVCNVPQAESEKGMMERMYKQMNSERILPTVETKSEKLTNGSLRCILNLSIARKYCVITYRID
ncbi:hypothetical protein EDB81DRAFT_495840 [Dactylonectria macrodidyma]|uniref:Uncharacterized protein n=1 Tax=Dactylonectria macrodidyma TaxID=307937 RepID=A0A9P9EWP0_9HYPO|nr:hypothetical protein EDB81DRAFT_495840 [Dactylonectria macrodidyma]